MEHYLSVVERPRWVFSWIVMGSAPMDYPSMATVGIISLWRWEKKKKKSVTFDMSNTHIHTHARLLETCLPAYSLSCVN